MCKHGWCTKTEFGAMHLLLPVFVAIWCYLFLLGTIYWSLFAIICSHMLLLTVCICCYLLILVIHFPISKSTRLPVVVTEGSLFLIFKGKFEGRSPSWTSRCGRGSRAKLPPQEMQGASGDAQCPPARMDILLPKPGYWQIGFRQISHTRTGVYHKYMWCSLMH